MKNFVFFSLVMIGSAIGGFALREYVTQAQTEENTILLSPLPAFSLPDTNGVLRQSEEWAGKIRIINFWASWCVPCVVEIPSFIAVQRHYGDKVQLIGIAIDDVDSAKKFAERLKINYPILVDDVKSIELAEKLGNRFGKIPYTVFVNSAGNIFKVHAGSLTYTEIEGIIFPELSR